MQDPHNHPIEAPCPPELEPDEASWKAQEDELPSTEPEEEFTFDDWAMI